MKVTQGPIICRCSLLHATVLWVPVIFLHNLSLAVLLGFRVFCWFLVEAYIYNMYISDSRDSLMFLYIYLNLIYKIKHLLLSISILIDYIKVTQGPIVCRCSLLHATVFWLPVIFLHDLSLAYVSCWVVGFFIGSWY